MSRSVSSRHFQSSSPLPQKGDIIKFPRGAYAHFGIYVGNGMIIHRSGPSTAPALAGAKNSKAEIRKDRLQDIVGDAEKAEIFNFLDEKQEKYSPDEIVKRATQQLGEPGYNLLSKNCEHFVTWCRYGEAISEQVNIAKAIIAFVSPPASFIVEFLDAVHKSKHPEGQ